jgi:hypothetical protein
MDPGGFGSCASTGSERLIEQKLRQPISTGRDFTQASALSYSGPLW